MPELPDVEVYKRYLDATSLHKTIRDVKVEDRRDSMAIHKKYQHSRRNDYASVKKNSLAN
jgi:formamidopyrimidine-DNA glycosylase